MTNTSASAFRPTVPNLENSGRHTWVQIDLGETRPIDYVKVYLPTKNSCPATMSISR